MIDESLLAKVSSLSRADRLELIGVVWDTLSADDLQVTDGERALLDARLADMERNPDDQSPWPEVKARLEQQRGIHLSTRSVGSNLARRFNAGIMRINQPRRVSDD